MATYQKAGDDVQKLLQAVLKKHHFRLAAEGVTVEVLMACAPADSDKPALVHHGYPAHAIIKINSLKDRAKGCADAELRIDERFWASATEKERLALLDHELEHLQVIEKDGKAARDDLGRPKLRLRLHDWQIGVFSEVARRHGPASGDLQAVEGLVKAYQ